MHKYMKRVLIAISFICLHIACYAQVKTSENELLEKIKNESEDTTRVKLYIELSDLDKLDNNKQLEYLNNALEISERIKWKKGLASSNYSLGEYYHLKQNDAALALKYFLKTLEYGRDNPSAHTNALSLISSIYLVQCNFDLSLKYASEAVELAEEYKLERHKARALISLASTYYQKKEEYGLVRKYYLEALAILEKYTGAEFPLDQVTHIYVFLGEVEIQTNGDFGKCIAYYKKAESLWVGEYYYRNFHAALLIQMSWMYLDIIENNDLEKYRLLKKDKKDLVAEVDNNLRIILEIKNLNKDNGIPEINVLQIEYRLDRAKGNYEVAMTAMEKYIIRKDSVYSQEIKNKLATLENEKEIELRDQQIQIKELELNAKNKQTAVYIGGIAFLVFCIAMLLQQAQTRKKMNRKLQKANEELVEANELKARFFGILNHDLRAPVASLINFLQLKKADDGYIDEKAMARHEKQTIESTENLLYNMEELLFWTKSQMQLFEPKPKIVLVKRIFDDTQLFFNYASGVDISFDTNPDFMLTTDDNYLKTIVRNLTANAIEAMAEKEDGFIRWTARKTTSEIILSIQDNAGGISQKIKDILEHKDGSNQNIEEGIGIYIIRDLAKAINCKISVSTENGEGTIFELIFDRED